jgi:hypothetical protein
MIRVRGLRTHPHRVLPGCPPPKFGEVAALVALRTWTPHLDRLNVMVKVGVWSGVVLDERELTCCRFGASLQLLSAFRSIIFWNQGAYPECRCP